MPKFKLHPSSNKSVAEDFEPLTAQVALALVLTQRRLF